MNHFDQITTAMDRTIEAVTLRPGIGQDSQVMHTEVAADGRCTIKDGDATMEIDLSEEFGGAGSTLAPGFYVRAALGACLAQGYLVWAAKLGVPINRLNVELHSDYDMRGNLGIDESVARSYLGVRYVVNIDSPAPYAAVEEVINKSDDLDFVRDVFARAIPLEREIRVTRSEAAE